MDILFNLEKVVFTVILYILFVAVVKGKFQAGEEGKDTASMKANTYDETDNIGECVRLCVQNDCLLILYGDNLSGASARQNCGQQFNSVGQDEIDKIKQLPNVTVFLNENKLLTPDLKKPTCDTFIFVSEGTKRSITTPTGIDRSCRLLVVTYENTTLILEASLQCNGYCSCEDILHIKNVWTSTSQSEAAMACLGIRQTLRTGSADGSYVIIELNKSNLTSLVTYEIDVEGYPSASPPITTWPELIKDKTSFQQDPMCYTPQNYAPPCVQTVSIPSNSTGDLPSYPITTLPSGFTTTLTTDNITDLGQNTPIGSSNTTQAVPVKVTNGSTSGTSGVSGYSFPDLTNDTDSTNNRSDADVFVNYTTTIGSNSIFEDGDNQKQGSLQETSGPGSGTIAGAVVGSVLGLLLVAGLLVYLKNRHNRVRPGLTTNGEDYFITTAPSSSAPASTVPTNMVSLETATWT